MDLDLEEWSPYVLRKSYESLLLSFGVWEFLVPYIIWGQRVVFFSLLIVASVGRRLRLRRKYVEVLDKIFYFASAQSPPLVEEEEEEEEDLNKDNVDTSAIIDPESPHAGSYSNEGSYAFEDAMPYMAAGMRAVVQDCVNRSFSPSELRTWNMLSRTMHTRNLRLSPSLTVFWMVGFFIRYFFLLPMRMLVLILSVVTLTVLCTAVGFLPEGDFKKKVNAWVVTWCFDFVAGSLSVVARFHDIENRPSHGIAVANHTSPIDSMVLATDQCYDMVGQKATGLLGMFMTALSKSSGHIWFDRSEARDRNATFNKLQTHAQNTKLPPILIYPEGTCVNNTAVMQFKKGAFEIDSVIYPIAIRFDQRYGNAFWYQDTFLPYAFDMMTSWAIVYDVWYMPPVRRREGESAVAFAQRVKTMIAHRGGFVELAWDGLIKLHINKEEVWKKKRDLLKDKQQQAFARHLSQPNGDEEEEEQNNKQNNDEGTKKND
ncbi:glycerol-3-phosphate acyltransferase 3-like [Palaemon carinicauda]|uniref:glycerol-3-phosphate acyltransferase 3-like n=1 Tax=Palaemon carinicauda TaxID=392227 RepID=UPI0035B676DB